MSGQCVADRCDPGGQHTTEERMPIGEGEPEHRGRGPHRAAQPFRERDRVVDGASGIDVTAEDERGTAGGAHLLDEPAFLVRVRHGATPYPAVEDCTDVVTGLGVPVVVGH